MACSVLDFSPFQEYHNKEATALGWGYVDKENLPKNLKEIKLTVTNTTMKNPRMIGTQVNYVKKEVEECKHCRDTCAGDSGETGEIFWGRLRLNGRDLFLVLIQINNVSIILVKTQVNF